MSMFDLKGRVAMVTGAGQGVGRGIAHALGASGAGGIVVNDFYADRANEVVEELRSKGVNAWAMVGDVSDIDAVRDGVGQAEAALGEISILINNAGNAGPQGFPSELPPFWETTPDRWQQFLRVNLIGVMNCCHTVLPGMVKRGYGRIVTITSDASRNLEMRQADYAAAKAGAAGFMRGLAADCARHGITANSIAIATMRPNMTDEEAADFMRSDRGKAQFSKYAIRRFGTPEDVAGVALLLSSDAASWITGQTYPVNGGYSSSL